jgi:glycerophosphoryl diester phosphodiesterase
MIIIKIKNQNVRISNNRKIRNKSFLYFLFIILVSIGPISEAIAKCPVRMGTEFPPKDFLVLADRGAAYKYPENTIPAFKYSIKNDLANALKVDLSFTLDKKVILWHDWDPEDSLALLRQEGNEPLLKFKPFVPQKLSKLRKKINQLTLKEFRKNYSLIEKENNVKTDVKVLTLKEFLVWANQQSNLKLVLFDLRIPDSVKKIAPIMFEEIKNIISELKLPPHYQIVFSTSKKKVLNLIKTKFKEPLFAYDREIPLNGVVNYDRYTTIPVAREFKNKFALIGLQNHKKTYEIIKPDPWVVYRFILTRDFKLRDNYKKAGFDYIKIIASKFNDENKMECLIRLGVDGIVTDRPKLLRLIALRLRKDLGFK